MVGVMVCKCAEPQSFATMSRLTRPVFSKVAAGIVDNVVQGGPAEFEEFVGANQSGQPASRIRRNLERARDAVQEARDAHSPGYNVMGNCAGAKLVARAGHAPLNMTEMFFRAAENPERPWAATYSVLTNNVMPADAWLRAVLDNALSRREDTNYSTTGSVASCQTCQETLYLTMCPERTC